MLCFGYADSGSLGAVEANPEPRFSPLGCHEPKQISTTSLSSTSHCLFSREKVRTAPRVLLHLSCYYARSQR